MDKQQLADEYTSSSYFSLEYSISGKTAQECNKAFIAGFDAAQSEIARLKEALDVAVEGLEALRLEIPLKHRPVLLQTLDKIKQIRENK